MEGSGKAFLITVGLYLYMHWLLAKGKVPPALMPFVEQLEMKELTRALALV